MVSKQKTVPIIALPTLCSRKGVKSTAETRLTLVLLRALITYRNTSPDGVGEKRDRLGALGQHKEAIG